MRESRTYGSVRGACDETHVPTATKARFHHAARRRGGGVAARGARAAAGEDAAPRHNNVDCGRCRRTGTHYGPARGAGETRVDGRPQSSHRYSLGRTPWKPILPLVRPQRCPTRSPPRLCGLPASSWASSRSICSTASIPAVRQKRSNELSTSCQAVSRLGTSANNGVVVVLVMALLSFADSAPRA